jgi:hypothetical protein
VRLQLTKRQPALTIVPLHAATPLRRITEKPQGGTVLVETPTSLPASLPGHDN